MQEIKYNYQNISAEVSADKVMIRNKHLFTNTSAFDCVVTLAKDGVPVYEAPMDTAVAPLSEQEYALPVRRADQPGEYTATVSFRLKEDTLWAKAGHEVAFGQTVYTADASAARRACTKPITVVRGTHNVGVRGENFEVLFSELFGGLSSYRWGGVEMLETIPKPNFWRAPVDNDEGSQLMAQYGQWKLASLYVTHKNLETNQFEDVVVEEHEGSVTVTFLYHLPTRPVTSCTVAYTVFGDGTVETTLSYDPVKELGDMPEFGMILKMNADYDHVEWYGMGPAETYTDRCEGAKLGIYRNQVMDNVARYMVPQECGNKVGVRWAKVTDRRGRGLMFEGDSMSFSALPWTPHEMENARHPYELPEAHYTVVRAAMQQIGIAGDDSWGARPLPEYLLDISKKMAFTFRFRGI